MIVYVKALLRPLYPIFMTCFFFIDSPADMICSIEDGLCSIHLPLAKICPIINSKANEVFSEDKNDYLDDLVSLECVKSFAANIYESFSSKPRN